MGINTLLAINCENFSKNFEMQHFTARKTCNPSPEHSLFKYILNYMPGRQDGTKKIPRLVYSYDYGSERLKFMPAAHPKIKSQYVAFIDLLSQEFSDTIVDFFANCYPLLSPEKKVTLLYSHDIQLQDIYKIIKGNKALISEISRVARSAEFWWDAVEMQKFGEKVSASMTPKFHPQLQKFNGMNKCLDYFTSHFASQGLMSIEVYDNRMLRSDNLITKVAVNNFMSQVDDPNPPQQIGAIINGRANQTTG
ncbi:hypothetical protein BWI92_21675 [Flectobacillus sp. BAB-3569]|nr:hypothetical protein BWI92_21675 [Flectobacillus sp. BAB-3569]